MLWRLLPPPCGGGVGTRVPSPRQQRPHRRQRLIRFVAVRTAGLGHFGPPAAALAANRRAAARTMATASDCPRSARSPATMLALPSAVETRATTPAVLLADRLRHAFQVARRHVAQVARRHADSRRSSSAAARRRRSPACFRSSATWRSSLRRSSISAAMRSGSSAGAARSTPAASFSRPRFPPPPLQRGRAGHRLDPADAGGDGAFADDPEQADIAGAPDMGAAAQLHRVGRPCCRRARPSRPRGPRRRISRRTAPWRRARPRHPASSAGWSTSDFSRIRAFTSASTAAQVLGRHRRGWQTSKRSRSGAFRLALLRDVRAERAAQRLVQQMGGAVVGADARRGARDRPSAHDRVAAVERAALDHGRDGRTGRPASSACR